MARPLRLEFPGACYHIIARGNFRFPVFRDGRDCERLLAGLVRYAEAFGVQVRAYCVMTNHSFVDRLRRVTASVSERSAVRRECGQQVKLLRWCRLRDVVHAVAGAYGLAPKDLLLRWSRANRPRQVLLYLASERCRGRYTATELARRLGRLSVSGLAKAHQRVKAEMAENTELRLSIRQAEGRIDEKSKA